MPNSLSPKKAPNALNQETLERALVMLRQPFSIAVIASLGLHGLLWAALPNVLADTEKVPDTKHRVQTVELSPAEQSQLPSFGISQVPQTLLPTKPTKLAQSGTKLPDPKLYNYPSLDTIPIFPPPPNILSPDFSSLFPKNLPAPTQNTRKIAPVNKSKTPPQPSVDPKTSEPKDPVNPDGKVNAPARSDKLSPEQLTALRQDAERSRQLQALYTFNGSETDKGKRIGEILPKNAAAFEDTVAAATGGNYDDSSYRKTPEKVDIQFPREACAITKEPFIKEVQNASVAAYVKDGNLVGQPGLLLTSGFQGLDELALSYVTKATFKPSDKPRIVRFDFIFDPRSVCPKPSKAA